MKINMIIYRYPELCWYIQYKIGFIWACKPHVFRAFKKWSGLNQESAIRVLSWTTNRPPIIRIKTIKPPQTDFATYSFHTNWIFLDAWICEIFEKNHDDPKAQRLLERTLLHELVHYGNHRYGTSRPAPPGTNDQHYIDGTETGMQFESEAYGSSRMESWTDFGEPKETQVRM